MNVPVEKCSEFAKKNGVRIGFRAKEIKFCEKGTDVVI